MTGLWSLWTFVFLLLLVSNSNFTWSDYVAYLLYAWSSDCSRRIWPWCMGVSYPPVCHQIWQLLPSKRPWAHRRYLSLSMLMVCFSSVENLSLALGVSTILKWPSEVLNIHSYSFGTRSFMSWSLVSARYRFSHSTFASFPTKNFESFVTSYSDG